MFTPYDAVNEVSRRKAEAVRFGNEYALKGEEKQRFSGLRHFFSRKRALAKTASLEAGQSKRVRPA